MCPKKVILSRFWAISKSVVECKRNLNRSAIKWATKWDKKNWKILPHLSVKTQFLYFDPKILRVLTPGGPWGVYYFVAPSIIFPTVYICLISNKPFWRYKCRKKVCFSLFWKILTPLDSDRLGVSTQKFGFLSFSCKQASMKNLSKIGYYDCKTLDPLKWIGRLVFFT